ncbi:alpha/beta-hydrolase [Sistotremastrum niveocremeum HHB9708]|uniref:Alpha/beta-hydrolase n=1 Tax=Sistotremastrum niveocremeum HHB9708 TaxID=1314777 RepID=A0A164N8F3_9AGAM|nr:alpha/beta-hydrolase [Sistotremastrum niveocremeum HHB9708]
MGKPLDIREVAVERTSRKPNRTVVVVLGILIFGACYRLGTPYIARNDVHTDLSVQIQEALTKPGDQFWWSCKNNVDCGRIAVPTDYRNESIGMTVLAVARWKALNSPSKGTVFTNPGGPGASGTLLASPWVANLVGNDYDIIGFDPRGIGQTTPTVRCHTPISKAFFQANTVLENGFSLPQTNETRLFSSETREYYRKQTEEFLALKKAEADLCSEHVGEALRYMGTTFVARDIDFMKRLFHGDDEPINFWSGSYGSILGAYLVNMFPDRIGRVAIDGIANPVSWAGDPSYLWARDWLSSTEDTYQWFLSACAKAGPAGCALAKSDDESAKAIGKRIDKFLDLLYDHPIPSTKGVRPGVLTAGAVRAVFLISLEGPLSWQRFAQDLAEAIYHDNPTPLYTRVVVNHMPYFDLSRSAVTCADSPPLSSTDPRTNPTVDDLIDEGLTTITKVSPHFGVSVTISEPDGGCQFWKYVGGGVERYNGPWNKTLSNKILIISNKADPVTPIASGKLLHGLLNDSSALLVQNSSGHTSGSFPTLCTVKLTRAYFVNGTLPAEGTICEPDGQLFPVSGKSDKLYENDELSDDDQVLLRSAEALGKLFTKRQ